MVVVLARLYSFLLLKVLKLGGSTRRAFIFALPKGDMMTRFDCHSNTTAMPLHEPRLDGFLQGLQLLLLHHHHRHRRLLLSAISNRPVTLMSTHDGRGRLGPVPVGHEPQLPGLPLHVGGVVGDEGDFAVDQTGQIQQEGQVRVAVLAAAAPLLTVAQDGAELLNGGGRGRSGGAVPAPSRGPDNVLHGRDGHGGLLQGVLLPPHFDRAADVPDVGGPAGRLLGHLGLEGRQLLLLPDQLRVLEVGLWGVQARRGTITRNVVGENFGVTTNNNGRGNRNRNSYK